MVCESTFMDLVSSQPYEPEEQRIVRQIAEFAMSQTSRLVALSEEAISISPDMF